MPPADAAGAKIPCPSPHSLQLELDSLAAILEPQEREDTWEKFEKAIIRFAAVTRGGGYKHLDAYVRGVGNKGVGLRLVDCMLSDRGRLSGVTTDLLQTFAPRLAGHFAPLVHLYLPPLIRLLARPNKVYLKRAEKCLLTIISHCPLPTILIHLRGGLDDKSDMCRRASGVAIERSVELWDRTRWHDKDLEILELCMRKMATDRGAEVRKTAKRVWALFADDFPERVEEFTTPLTPTIRRYLDIPPADGTGKPRSRPPPRPVFTAPAPARSQPTSSSLAGPSTAAVYDSPDKYGSILGSRAQRTMPRTDAPASTADPARRMAAPTRGAEPLPGRVTRSASSMSQHSTSSAASNDAGRNPLSRPSRPQQHSSAGSTHPSVVVADNALPARRFPPPARIVRQASEEEAAASASYTRPTPALTNSRPQRQLGAAHRRLAAGPSRMDSDESLKSASSAGAPAPAAPVDPSPSQSIVKHRVTDFERLAEEHAAASPARSSPRAELQPLPPRPRSVSPAFVREPPAPLPRSTPAHVRPVRGMSVDSPSLSMLVGRRSPSDGYNQDLQLLDISMVSNEGSGAGDTPIANRGDRLSQSLRERTSLPGVAQLIEKFTPKQEHASLPLRRVASESAQTLSSPSPASASSTPDARRISPLPRRSPLAQIQHLEEEPSPRSLKRKGSDLEATFAPRHDEGTTPAPSKATPRWSMSPLIAFGDSPLAAAEPKPKFTFSARPFGRPSLFNDLMSISNGTFDTRKPQEATLEEEESDDDDDGNQAVLLEDIADITVVGPAVPAPQADGVVADLLDDADEDIEATIILTRPPLAEPTHVPETVAEAAPQEEPVETVAVEAHGSLGDHPAVDDKQVIGDVASQSAEGDLGLTELAAPVEPVQDPPTPVEVPEEPTPVKAAPPVTPVKDVSQQHEMPVKTACPDATPASLRATSSVSTTPISNPAEPRRASRRLQLMAEEAPVEPPAQAPASVEETPVRPTAELPATEDAGEETPAEAPRAPSRRAAALRSVRATPVEKRSFRPVSKLGSIDSGKAAPAPARVVSAKAASSSAFISESDPALPADPVPTPAAAPAPAPVPVPAPVVKKASKPPLPLATTFKPAPPALTSNRSVSGEVQRPSRPPSSASNLTKPTAATAARAAAAAAAAASKPAPEKEPKRAPVRTAAPAPAAPSRPAPRAAGAAFGSTAASRARAAELPPLKRQRVKLKAPMESFRPRSGGTGGAKAAIVGNAEPRQAPLRARNRATGAGRSAKTTETFPLPGPGLDLKTTAPSSGSLTLALVPQPETAKAQQEVAVVEAAKTAEPSISLAIPGSAPAQPSSNDQLSRTPTSTSPLLVAGHISPASSRFSGRSDRSSGSKSSPVIIAAPRALDPVLTPLNELSSTPVSTQTPVRRGKAAESPALAHSRRISQAIPASLLRSSLDPASTPSSASKATSALAQIDSSEDDDDDEEAEVPTPVATFKPRHTRRSTRPQIPSASSFSPPLPVLAIREDTPDAKEDAVSDTSILGTVVRHDVSTPPAKSAASLLAKLNGGAAGTPDDRKVLTPRDANLARRGVVGDDEE
ncbi:hypothetical protein VHUM_02275 [Vanrija humicola]|uniref:CLASP N-terminal domain-containing protein n=1 Tax=Vanrija humicola TaxID=5417 RepID=A0A7D8V0I3_VANHU|nr:hypothetical protein VHUM_02275 [Vanrija humicola]